MPPLTHPFLLSLAGLSLPHQPDIPFVILIAMTIVFPVTAQIPGIHHFYLAKRQTVPSAAKDSPSLLATELSVAHSLSSLLRSASSPNCVGLPFSASAHNVSNVVRSRNISSRPSVLHYKTFLFNPFFIVESILLSSLHP